MSTTVVRPDGMRIDDRDAIKVTGKNDSAGVNGVESQKPRPNLPPLSFAPDEVTLSGQSSLVQLALQTGIEDEKKRVEDIRHAVENNSYQVDLEKVSKALLATIAWAGL